MPDETVPGVLEPPAVLTRHARDARTVSLQGELRQGWRLLHPIPVTIEQDTDGSYISSDEVFHVYGTGSTPNTALDDYVASLIDLYHFWEADAATGNVPDQKAFAVLCEFLKPAPL
jgi:hypothetical protein